MKWYNPQNAPFVISGFAFYEQDRLYRRMPLNPPAELPEAVYNLANETAGGQIRFHGKFKTMKIQVSLAAKPLYFDGVKSPHLAGTAKKAFDFYASTDGGDYQFINLPSDFDETDSYYEHTYVNSGDMVDVDVLLNFPLYGGVDRVLIGFDDEAEISEPLKQFGSDKKIIFYGSSIEQGACASRPGMCETNILSRWLNCEIFNLGFNSSGKAEPEVAQTIAEIENVAALVISVEGNCPDAMWLDEKLRMFIKIYREKNPDTAIIIMPFMESGVHKLLNERGKKKAEKYDLQVNMVKDFADAGDENIYLFSQDACSERDFEGHSVWHECFADGLHKTDLGYYWTSKGLYRLLKKLL